jgi:putative oxidoreductase
VRVNTVSPGPTRTPPGSRPTASAPAWPTHPASAWTSFLAAFSAQASLSSGRLTEPDEVAAAVAFLASARARNIHGSNLVIDGGQSKIAI